MLIILLKNDFFGFPKVKLLQHTGNTPVTNATIGGYGRRTM